MKIFLAATSDKPFLDNIGQSKYILESFYYFKEWQVPLIKDCDMFLLDSGAFTFMNLKRTTNFDEYLTKYIKFINKYDVKYFFELDVDAVVGYEKVLEYRQRLEKETGKKCIPVFHRERGKEEYLKMCDNYDYVAIGGLVGQGYCKKDYKYFDWFIAEAHKRGCQIHGLGFTDTRALKRYHFDSVDSTSWKSGGRFGQLHMYRNGEIKIISNKSKRAIYKRIDQNNFNQWVKYQQYAERHL